MECKAVKELLWDYCDGTLDTQKRMDVEAHLETCPLCAKEAVSLKVYAQEMKTLKDVKAPEDFLNQVHQRIARRSEFEKIVRMFFVPVRVKVPLGAAGILVVFMLVISVVRVHEPLKQLASLPQISKTKALLPGEITGKAFLREMSSEGMNAVRRDFKAGTDSLVEKDQKPIEFARKPETDLSAVLFEGEEKTSRGVVSQYGIRNGIPTMGKGEGKDITAQSFQQEKLKNLTQLPQQSIASGNAVSMREINGVAQTVSPLMKSPSAAVMREKKETAALSDLAATDQTAELLTSPGNSLSQVQNLIRETGGKVIAIKYIKEPQPEFITAEIPIKQYAVFLEKLALIKDIKQPLPSNSIVGKESVTLRIEFILSH